MSNRLHMLLVKLFGCCCHEPSEDKDLKTLKAYERKLQNNQQLNKSELDEFRKIIKPERMSSHLSKSHKIMPVRKPKTSKNYHQESSNSSVEDENGPSNLIKVRLHENNKETKNQKKPELNPIIVENLKDKKHNAIQPKESQKYHLKKEKNNFYEDFQKEKDLTSKIHLNRKMGKKELEEESSETQKQESKQENVAFVIKKHNRNKFDADNQTQYEMNYQTLVHSKQKHHRRSHNDEKKKEEEISGYNTQQVKSHFIEKFK